MTVKKPWAKFYWNDWRGDPRLRVCGLAARGLWIEMLCIMAESDPTGYLTVGGMPLEITALARLAGSTESEVEPLLNELERNGVFSRDARGRIYSRRMLADEKKSKTSRQNGKNGGNPNLSNKKGNSARDNPPLNPRDKAGVKPQRPEARDQNNLSKDKLSEGASPPEDGKDWWFKGDVIRLNQRDYSQWQRMAGLSDMGLQTYLEGRDQWLARQAEHIRKQWFISTKRDLDRIAKGGRT